MLAMSEVEKFESLFKQIPEALAVLRGPDFIFERANDQYLKLVGNRDVVGKALLVALPELAQQEFPVHLRRVFETGEAYSAREARVELNLTPDVQGAPLSSVYVDLTYRQILGSDQKPYGIFVFAIDVTEKVIARQAVLVEQLKLEAVFANASAALAILRGPSGVYEKANRSYFELFNDRPLVGRSLLDALPELRGQKFPDLIEQVYLTGETYVESEAEAFLRRTADSPLEKRYFDQSYTQIKDAQGEKYGVLIQAIDVSERVRARGELLESSKRYEEALRSANMGTWAVDVQTGRLEWSARARELFGMSADRELKMMDAVARIHPEDRPKTERAIAAATDPKGDGRYEIDYRVVNDDESIRWLSLRGQAYFEDSPHGRVTKRFSGTMLDVTERVMAEEAIRQSELQFRRIADLMPQVVWTARADGVLDYTNARWTQYSGNDDPSQWLSFVHPDDVSEVTRHWISCVESGRDYQAEFRLRRASDQSYRWFLVRAQATRDSEGEIERWFGTCTDIEEQKAALAERSNFISIASHELKTPLTSLKLQTQSMRRNYEKKRVDAFTLEKVIQLVANNEKQIGRLIRLVDDMLDFSKIESGKLSMVKERVDVCELVREVHERLKEQLEAAGCESRVDCGPSTFAVIDRFRIEQVVTNLLTNAIRYGKGRPVDVSVRDEKHTVVIAVKDQGTGIAKENQERIFNRFERAVSASEVSGLGLGLFITKEIVEAHQGRITVESELGRGSTFRIVLPLGEPSHV